MNYNFKTYTLSELYDISSGLSKKREEFGFGAPFLTFKEVFHNPFVPEKLSELANTSEKEQLKCSIEEGDVFLTRTSEKFDELGLSSVALKDYPNATFNGFTKRLRPNNLCKDILLPKYAAFYFRSFKFRNQVTSFSSMTTRASLNNEMISKLTIDIPSIETQENIIDIMWNLLEKENINVKIINSLEKMSQTLFKHWFIDFEFPNEQGQPYKSSGGEKVESELGKIPKGWGVFHLNEFAESVSNSINKKEVKEARFLNTSDILEGHIADVEFNFTKDMPGQAKKLIQKKDILYSEIRPKNKRYAYVHLENASEYVVSTKLMVIRVNEDIFSSKLLYLWLTMDEIVKQLQQIAEDRSGTFPQITFSILSKFKFALPIKATLNRFENALEPLLDEIYELQCENKKLAELRDALLPKLLSGEIEIPDELGV
ncbi:restriction endonuclease subunit S [Peribacillus butanolivorans]|uniref:restriction endonuclease subunit S n=1 Tax=Peribacillus butanolivorans TaxID=421767 RepID=UPI00365E02DD